MPCISNSNAFPCIMQNNRIYCIPASIENVMKYHRVNSNITQNRIVNLYTQIRQLNTISFPHVSSILRRNYGRHWDFSPNQWPNIIDLYHYINQSINNDYPVITSMRLPRSSCAHMFTILCITQNDLTIYDTGFRRPRIITRNFFQNNLAPSRGTLLISPK